MAPTGSRRPEPARRSDHGPARARRCAGRGHAGTRVLGAGRPVRAAPGRAGDAGAPVHVYAPPALTMGRPSNRGGEFEGENPSPDLPIYYHLGEELAGGHATLSIDVLDGDGQRSAPLQQRRKRPGPLPARRHGSAQPVHHRPSVKGSGPAALAVGPARRRPALYRRSLRCSRATRAPPSPPGRLHRARVRPAPAAPQTAVEVLPDPRAKRRRRRNRAWVAMQAASPPCWTQVLSGAGRGAGGAQARSRHCRRNTAMPPCRSSPMPPSRRSTPGSPGSPSCATRPSRTRTPGS
jgi:hypothetical protein